MKPNFLLRIAVLLSVLFYSWNTANACSGYKITVGGRTFFGSNEDAWRLTPHIWFEVGNDERKFGAAFTGSRWVGGIHGYTPQSGMNEEGLAFERLVSYFPQDNSWNPVGLKQITNEAAYLKDVLHSCRNIDEAKAFIDSYDHSFFMDDVFFYFEPSGRYMVVEPYSTTIGNEPNYVFANFCPSITSENDANKLTRYHNGVEFLKGGADSTLAFCTALSDTMHVCREKIGDGTLLTSIWDLNNRIVNLFFYHKYDTTVQFNVLEELKKGDHLISLKELFPANAEFERLGTYKTPLNTQWIAVVMMLSAGLFLFSAFFFLVKFFRTKPGVKYRMLQLLMFPLGLMMFYFMFVLETKMNIYYFSSPYVDPHNVFTSISSYLPFLIAILIIPFLIINFGILKEKSWGWMSKGLFTLSNVAYVLLIGLFIYWGFYDVL